MPNKDKNFNLAFQQALDCVAGGKKLEEQDLFKFKNDNIAASAPLRQTSQ